MSQPSALRRRSRGPSLIVAILALTASFLTTYPAHAAPVPQASDLPGLRGDYYTASGGGTGATDWTFGTYKNTIVDPNVYFDDLTGRLALLTGSSDNAAIRWTGNIDVPTTGTYAFNWYGDNGFRLYIDGTAVIDHWINDWNINVPGSADLTAGRHTVKVEYFQGNGGAFAHLTWALPGQQQQTRIPDSAFTLPDGYVPTVTNAVVATDGKTARITFAKPLGSWPAGATSHLSLGFPISSATIDRGDPSTLVVTLNGTVYRSWSVFTAGYDGNGGATYADGSAVPAFYASAQNKSTANLLTKWAKDVNPANPLPDYPRPQMTRQDWKNLNGIWDFQGLSSADALKTPPPAGTKFDSSIVVPYPMESALSKVQKHYDYSFYRRTFTVPQQWVSGQQRVILNFGAVNYQATVWVNGKQVATHTGGYLPFSVDITDALNPTTGATQEIVVGVANTGAPQQTQGKQRLDPSGIFYTASTGIWQTVWLEPAPAERIDQVTFTPKLPNAPSTTGASVTALVSSSTAQSGAVNVTITDGAKVVAQAQGPANQPFDIPLPNAHLWSPDRPFLYQATVTLQDGGSSDTVGSYFGERTVSTAEVNGVPKIMLNGKPTFVNATLDQGFWPDGVYTAPTDTALKWDISETKSMGFNGIRKHIKVEPARWYYYADKLGMLVLQDMPSMNDGYSPTAADDTAFRGELHQMVEDLKGTTSIISWEPYNEGWGMDRNNQANAVSEVETAAAQIAADDPSRLVDAESGFNCCGSVNTDTGAGNVVDWHTYTGPAMPQPDAAHGRVAIDGEHGGWGMSIPQDSWNSGFINYAGANTTAELTDRFVQTQTALKFLAGCDLSGGVYTQLTDVEGEVNGLWTYDRKVPKMDMAQVKAINQAVIKAGSNAGDCGSDLTSKPGSWPLTDGSGTTAKDTSGSGNDLTLANGPVWTTDGPNGGGLQFDSTDQQYAQTAGPVLNASQSYTVSAWVKLTDKNNFHTAVGQDGPVYSSFYLQYVRDQDRLSFSALGTRATSSFSPQTGAWYHMVGVLDAGANALTLYVNGTQEGTATGVQQADPSTGPLTVGRALYNATKTDFWSGSITDVQVFPKALSAAEVAALT
ncbi:MAG TPA: LamG-like jellyroll fold domain-containing protein [Jatrophihabitans sp.]|nr:LamG-like jellyroll fold domain-containing protein [Jatrophihabitans sp.]